MCSIPTYTLGGGYRGNAHTCGRADDDDDDDDANRVRVPITERKRGGARHPYAPHRVPARRRFSPIAVTAGVSRVFRTVEAARRR